LEYRERKDENVPVKLLKLMQTEQFFTVSYLKENVGTYYLV